uniref:coiled-coil domain-containing protein 43 n=1 Tax=Myxine glutinosa TaxID=7769 RepID=UPI00358FC148
MSIMATSGGSGSGNTCPEWLRDRLEELGVDADVYGAYIGGVMEGDESDAEKREALSDILSAMLEDTSLDDLCSEIVSKWNEMQTCLHSSEGGEDSVQVLMGLMERQVLLVESAPASASTENNVEEAEERRRREALIAQYGMLEEHDNVEEEEDGTSASGNTDEDPVMFQNTNASKVAQAQRETRERSRLETQQRRVDNAQQRERDRQARQEKLDERRKKCQRGERRR